MPKLTVIVDGTPMPDEEARLFWNRFSEHMEAHKGDLAGFAKAEGFASVRPAMGPEGAQLVVSRTANQEPYGNARSSSGSSPVHPKPAKGRESSRKHKK
jgi:hypothetical protein